MGAANKFESSITKIQSASPAIVLQTLVGGDNVNFNRTFANFGLSSKILRMSCLLEENTLMGIGADASENLYSCMGYFANLKIPQNVAYLDAIKQNGGGAAVQNTIAKSVVDGIFMAKAVIQKAQSTEPKAFDKAVEGTTFDTPSGSMTMIGRHTSKTMYLAHAKGTEFEVVETYENVPTQQKCN
jgi:urea transport system substrate-binding protein